MTTESFSKSPEEKHINKDTLKHNREMGVSYKEMICPTCGTRYLIKNIRGNFTQYMNLNECVQLLFDSFLCIGCKESRFSRIPAENVVIDIY